MCVRLHRLSLSGQGQSPQTQRWWVVLGRSAPQQLSAEKQRGRPIQRRSKAVALATLATAPATLASHHLRGLPDHAKLLHEQLASSRQLQLWRLRVPSMWRLRL
jgi:hypothetical protein